MKTKILLLGAAITAFTFSTFAADALLTPRQQENQVQIVTSSINTQGGTITYITSASPATLSPRAQASQINVVAGVSNERNPAVECRNMMSGNPKAVGECASHTTMPGCVTVAPLK